MARMSWEWTEKDLLKMKNAQTEESLTLDFKDSASLGTEDRKKNEISKDVSAFANSEGGDIIYGVSEVGTRPSRFGSIDSGIDASAISPEWLEQIINSRIHPRIDGIKIKAIALKKTHPGRYVYVVHVPASRDAPHQAFDKKYYKRFNFVSEPMEDYEVRDVRNRWVAPRVVAEIRGKNRSPDKLWNQKRKAQITLSIVLKNVGKKTAQQVYLECDFPIRYFYGSVVRIEGKNESFMLNGEQYRQLRYHHRDESGSLPLFPDTDHEVLDGNKLYVHMEMSEEQATDSMNKFIYWKVYADGAEPETGEISIGEIFQP